MIPPVRLPMRPAACRALLLAALAGAAWSADAQVDPAGAILEDLRAANLARAALATETAAWQVERERLEAVREAVSADIERLERECAASEAQRAANEAQLASLGAGADDLGPLQARLAQTAAAIQERLVALARALPPGAVAVPTGAGAIAFDEAIRALDATERAASTVTIEVVPGELGGQPVAVKLLRVAGACAWWVGMDGGAAGTAGMRDGRLVLTPAGDDAARARILRALAIAEGRHPAELLALPVDPTLATVGTGAQP